MISTHLGNTCCSGDTEKWLSDEPRPAPASSAEHSEHTATIYPL